MRNYCILSKYQLLIVIFFFISVLNLFSGSDSFFINLPLNVLNSDEDKIISNILADSAVENYQIVHVNSKILHSSFVVNFTDKVKFEVRMKKDNELFNLYDLNGQFCGSLFEKGSTYRGIFFYEDNLFELKPLQAGKHILLRIDPTKSQINESTTHIVIDTSFNKYALSRNLLKEKIASISDECNIRVLVAYTPSARNRRGGEENINADIELAVLLTNQSYANSLVNQRLELARTILTNYTETGNWNRDVSRFFNSNDGFMDEIHTLRDNYAADFLVLILDDDTYCGQATGIMANSNTAYCVVSSYYSCLTSNFSFAHELGHLMGCRHNPEADNNNVPFAYGHGYCYPQGNWRTIMSYNNNCANRLQFWSNPDVLFNNIPMGTQQTHNNARVLNETEDIVKEFRITPVNYVIPDETISAFNIADLLARSVLSSSSSFIASSNSQVTFRAGDEIILGPGFHAEQGSNFHAYIESCGNNYFARTNTGAENLYSNIQKGLYNSLTIHPNPFESETRITVALSEPSDVRLEVFDLLGNRVAIIASGEQFPIGSHDFTLSGHKHTSGVYYLKLTTNKEHISRQLLLIK